MLPSTSLSPSLLKIRVNPCNPGGERLELEGERHHTAGTWETHHTRDSQEIRGSSESSDGVSRRL